MQELQKRSLIHLRGCETLPSLHEGELRDERNEKDFETNKRQAQSELGCLLWLATKTRGDIAAVVGSAATTITRTPTESLRLARGVWRYLRATCFLSVRYRGVQGNTLTGYSGASFAPGGTRSRTGTVICWGEDPLLWSSKRQALTAFSTCEAERLRQ